MFFDQARSKCFTIIVGILLGLLFISYLNSDYFSSKLFACRRLQISSKLFYQRAINLNNQAASSLDSKIRYELQNNLIIAVAERLPLSTLHRFTQSARSSCNSCILALFMDHHSIQNNDVQLLAELFNVILIPFERLLPVNDHQAFRIMNIHSRRWIMYSMYLQTLQNEGKKYHNVFICDLSDTIFQSNVFAHMNTMGDGLYAFMEDATVTILQQNVNRDWIKICYGNRMLDILGNKSISCSGTVLGSWSAIVSYLSKMSSELLSRSQQCLRSLGYDQGVHNFIIHNKLVPNTTIHIVPHETGFVGTVGLPKWLKRNKFGYIINNQSKIYAVVHQINRSPQLTSQFNRIYQILPDDILNKKL